MKGSKGIPGNRSSSRWRFPRIEGIAVRHDTGEWSDSAFFNDLLDAEDQEPQIWHQAQPADEVTDIGAWKRWAEYLRRPDAAETLRQLALLDARSKIARLSQTSVVRASEE